MNLPPSKVTATLPPRQAALFALVAVVAFQLAYTFAACGFLIAVFLYCLYELTRVGSGRLAFYGGLVMGLLAYAPQLSFFWNIFGAAAIPLWVILAFWLALFLALARACRLRLGGTAAAILIPFLWTGLEYFRSELYYLRFAWLNAGYALSGSLRFLPVGQTGVYGLGFALMAAGCLLGLVEWKKRAVIGSALLASLGLLTNLHPGRAPQRTSGSNTVAVAGVQLEFPSEAEVLTTLNQLVKDHPDAQLLVLSEYTFDGPVPDGVKAWCRRHQRHLIIGAKDPVSGSQFYDTAFVVGPDGDIIFRQGKSVPIQFFKDGLPAREQKLWESPWGRIGICICYDLSYTRVTDELVRQGAQALIVPTMDVVDWGRRQHEMHARVAPMRAAEYGIPIFRLASSGISQYVGPTGATVCQAPFPGAGATLQGLLDLGRAGRLPWDRVLAPVAVAVTGTIICGLAFISRSRKNPANLTS